MDRNSIIGSVLIAGIVMFFYGYLIPKYDTKPVPKTAKIDSLKQKNTSPEAAKYALPVVADTAYTNQVFSQKYGKLAAFAQGKEALIVLQNDLVKVMASSKGGKIIAVELKKYKTYDKKALMLFKPEEASYNYTFMAQNRQIRSEDLYYSLHSQTDSSVNFRLQISPTSYLEQTFVLSANSYVVKHSINTQNFGDVLDKSTPYIVLDWKMQTPSQEQNMKEEQLNSNLYYKNLDKKADYISANGSENLEQPIKWISFKQKFFSAALIAQTQFTNVSGSDKNGEVDSIPQIIKQFGAQLRIPMPEKDNGSTQLSFYFGPNHYKTLEKLDIDLEEEIPLGWGIFGWVNKFLIIPLFHFLDGFKLGYGLIILLITIVIRLIIFPFTYKSFLSTAKMRILQPEITELKAKFEKDPTKMQAEQLKLFQKAGVNPLGGCLPMLFQMPILFAVFRFFPAAIELRQQPFLWADDLSRYDSIASWSGNIPLISSTFGNHISLFTLLMTATTLFQMWQNNKMTAGSNDQMKQMQVIMYIMPVMFLFVLNSYASGLNYYYFLSNVLGILQMWLIKKSVDETKIHAQIQDNKKKNAANGNKKTGFMARLEAFQQKAEQAKLNQKK